MSQIFEHGPRIHGNVHQWQGVIAVHWQCIGTAFTPLAKPDS